MTSVAQIGHGQQSYEETLTIEELRIEVRRLWNQIDGMTTDLHTLPAVPSLETLRLLGTLSGGLHTEPSLGILGIALRQTCGIDAVPPVSEMEHGAGLWKVIRDALILAGVQTNPKSVDASTAEG